VLEFARSMTCRIRQWSCFESFSAHTSMVPRSDSTWIVLQLAAQLAGFHLFCSTTCALDKRQYPLAWGDGAPCAGRDGTRACGFSLAICPSTYLHRINAMVEHRCSATVWRLFKYFRAFSVHICSLARYLAIFVISYPSHEGVAACTKTNKPSSGCMTPPSRATTRREL
jgi:hypothetical protein